MGMMTNYYILTFLIFVLLLPVSKISCSHIVPNLHILFLRIRSFNKGGQSMVTFMSKHRRKKSEQELMEKWRDILTNLFQYRELVKGTTGDEKARIEQEIARLESEDKKYETLLS